jgi:hypothetical protein
MTAYENTNPAFVMLSSSIDDVQTLEGYHDTDPFDLANTLDSFSYGFGDDGGGRYFATFRVINPSRQLESTLMALYGHLYAYNNKNIGIRDNPALSIAFYYRWGYSNESLSTIRMGVLGTVKYTVTAGAERVVTFTILDNVSFNDMQEHTKKDTPFQIHAEKDLFVVRNWIEKLERGGDIFLKPSEAIPEMLSEFTSNYKGVTPVIKPSTAMKIIDNLYDKVRTDLKGDYSQAWGILARTLGFSYTNAVAEDNTGILNPNVQIKTVGLEDYKDSVAMNLSATLDDPSLSFYKYDTLVSIVDGVSSVLGDLEKVYKAIEANPGADIKDIPVYETTIGNIFPPVFFPYLKDGRTPFIPEGDRNKQNLGTLVDISVSGYKQNGLVNYLPLRVGYFIDFRDTSTRYTFLPARVNRFLSRTATVPTNESEESESVKVEEKFAKISMTKPSFRSLREVMEDVVRRLNNLLKVSVKDTDGLLQLAIIPVSELSEDEKKDMEAYAGKTLKKSDTVYIIDSFAEIVRILSRSPGDIARTLKINSFPEIGDPDLSRIGVETFDANTVKLTVGYDDSVVIDMDIQTDIRAPIIAASAYIKALTDLNEIFGEDGKIRESTLKVITKFEDIVNQAEYYSFKDSNSEIFFPGSPASHLPHLQAAVQKFTGSLKAFEQTTNLTELVNTGKEFLAGLANLDSDLQSSLYAGQTKELVERFLLAVENQLVQDLLFDVEDAEYVFSVGDVIRVNKRQEMGAMVFKPNVFAQGDRGLSYILKEKSILNEIYSKYFLQVDVKCLGIPEFSSSYKDIRFRRVALLVSDPRSELNEDGTDRLYHWSTGLYRLIGYTHNISPSEGYTMTMNLERAFFDEVNFTPVI